jgi:hypothetical protein
MIRWLGSILGLSVLLGIAGCGDPNAGALFADIQYATRCEETRHCGGPVDRDICGFNQSDPCDEDAPEAQVSCNVQQEETGRTLSFSATQGSGFSIRVDQAVFLGNSSVASGPSCRVTVVEGANRYVGTCGGATPSESQPCQITDVRFEDDMGNPTVQGRIFCQHLPSQASPTLKAEVTAMGDGPTPASTPGRFRLANCSGLSI